MVSAAALVAVSSALIDASRISIVATSGMTTPDKNADSLLGRGNPTEAEANWPDIPADEASTGKLQEPDGSARVSVPRIDNEAAPVQAQPDKAAEPQMRPDNSTDSDLRADPPSEELQKPDGSVRVNAPRINNEVAPVTV